MTQPLDNPVPSAEDEFGIHMVITDGEEWSSVSDGPDPRWTAAHWRDFDPARSHLTPLPQVIAELRACLTR